MALDEGQLSKSWKRRQARKRNRAKRANQALTDSTTPKKAKLSPTQQRQPENKEAEPEDMDEVIGRRGNYLLVALALFALLMYYPIIPCLLCVCILIRRWMSYYGITRNITYQFSEEDFNVFSKYKNFLIIGSQSCGKSSLAKQLKSSFPHLELVEFDELYWTANWKKNNYKFYRSVKTTLLEKIQSAHTAKGYEYRPRFKEGVIMDGNFNIIKEITWNLADVVIWLDYEFAEVFYRAITRELYRAISQQKVCNGNVVTFERLCNQWSECVIYKVWKHHQVINEQRIPNDYIKVFPEKKVIRLQSPYQCDLWLRRIMNNKET